VAAAAEGPAVETKLVLVAALMADVVMAEAVTETVAVEVVTVPAFV